MVLSDRRARRPAPVHGALRYLLTAWRLGRYYRTYPAYVQDEITAVLAAPSDFQRGPRTTARRGTSTDHSAAYVVEDGNYLSARWPGDAYLFAERLLAMLEGTRRR